MTDMNPTPSERPDKDQEPKNQFFETAKQKTVEFIRIATPIVQAGLKTAIRGIRHGIAVGKERFMQLDHRRQLIVIAVAGISCLFFVTAFLASPFSTVDIQVANLYAQDTTINENADTFEKLRQAAERGDVDSQHALGIRFFIGNGVTKDVLEALKWWRKAAEQGHVAAQNNLGVFYECGEGVTKDLTEAVKWYRRAAEQGNANAQFALGHCYENGNGVTNNLMESVKWYRQAAEQGHVTAQNNLGFCYAEGKGVTKDLTESVKWYRRAAEQGYHTAQNNLGTCYFEGKGVTKDLAEAVKWFRSAAEQGYPSAQFNLASCYFEGDGVSQDYTEARKWLYKAAEQGDVGAQMGLSLIYERGKGVVKNNVEALKWMRQAAAQGNSVARQYLDHYAATGFLVPYKDIYEAIEDENLKAVQDFLVANPELIKQSVLHRAAQKNKTTEILKYLVSMGADVNKKDGFGHTPLHYAASSNKNLAVIKCLVEEAGGDINVKNMLNQNAILVSQVHENDVANKYLTSLPKDFRPVNRLRNQVVQNVGPAKDNAKEIEKVLSRICKAVENINGQAGERTSPARLKEIVRKEMNIIQRLDVSGTPDDFQKAYQSWVDFANRMRKKKNFDMLANTENGMSDVVLPYVHKFYDAYERQLSDPSKANPDVGSFAGQLLLIHMLAAVLVE